MSRRTYFQRQQTSRSEKFNHNLSGAAPRAHRRNLFRRAHLTMFLFQHSRRLFRVLWWRTCSLNYHTLAAIMSAISSPSLSVLGHASLMIDCIAIAIGSCVWCRAQKKTVRRRQWKPLCLRRERENAQMENNNFVRVATMREVLISPPFKSKNCGAQKFNWTWKFLSVKVGWGFSPFGLNQYGRSNIASEPLSGRM